MHTQYKPAPLLLGLLLSSVNITTREFKNLNEKEEKYRYDLYSVSVHCAKEGQH